MSVEKRVPFRGQESRWAEYGVFSQENYRAMLKFADNVIYLHETNDNAVSKLMERNVYMMDRANEVIAMTKDLDINGKGGTMQAIRYAVKNKKPVRLLCVDESMQVTALFLIRKGLKS